MERIQLPIPRSHVGSVSKGELVRLLAGGLRDLGFQGSARALESESGVASSSNTASEFLSLLSEKRYDSALGLLDSLPFRDGTVGRKRARTLIVQEQYLNCLLEQNMDEALARLREEVFFLSNEDDYELSTLSAMLACPNADELRKFAGRYRARQAKRYRKEGCLSTDVSSSAVDRIRALLDTDAVVPPQRLLSLLGQALAQQAGDHANLGRLHDQPLPLLRDLREVEEQRYSLLIPSAVCRRVVPITGHSGLVEIWCVSFEDDEHSSKVAIGTRDGSLHIIETSTGTILESHEKVFRFDGRPIVHLDWFSPFGLLAVSCESSLSRESDADEEEMDHSDGEDGSEDERQQRRNSSLIRRILPGARELRPSRAVFHGGRPLARWTNRGGVLTSGADGWIRSFNRDLQLENSVKVERVVDIACNAERTINFMACADNVIRAFKGLQLLSCTLTTATSIVALACGAHTLAASLSNQTLAVWDLKDAIADDKRTPSVRSTPAPLVFHGFSRRRLALRPSVGPGDIVATGSEDGVIHVFSCFTVAAASHKEVALLRGHVAAVNEVCFSPKVPGMLASVGDDGSLRLWSRSTQDEHG